MTPTQAKTSSSKSYDESQSCPCGSELALKECCLPMIRGKKDAATATDLLRSRYTAFAIQEIDYIVKTHHSKTRGDVKREEIEDWAKNSKWLALKVAQTEAGTEKDDKGTIVFCAEYQPIENGKEGEKTEHWEQSFFEKEGGQWRFLDAKGVHVGTYRRAEPKIGRNDPCPCGSGKKHKKCCAA